MKSILTCCLIFTAFRGGAQCNADKIPPVLSSAGIIQVALGGPRCLATVKPADLLLSYLDNCTPSPLLTLRLRKAGTGAGFPDALTGDQLVLSPGDLGKPFIAEVWARDSSQNSAFVYAGITVTNPSGCSFSVLPDDICAGTLDGHGLEEVQFELDGTVAPDTGSFTTQYGCVILSAGLLTGDSAQNTYRITPVKDNDPLNGVSTYDAVKTFQHVLGKERFNNPYAIIAADIDRNGQVSMEDVVELRKLILGIYTEFPNNTSWRFVPEDFHFPHPENPFAAYFPESVTVNKQRFTPLPDFVAIKIGDINGNAVSNSIMEVNDRSPILLRMPDTWFPAGATIPVPLYSDEQAGVSGFQFDLQFDEKTFDLIDVYSDVLPDFSAANYNLRAPGALTVSYITTQEYPTQAETPLLYLELKSRTATALHRHAPFLTASRIQPEWYDDSGRLARLNLRLEPMQPPAQTLIYPLAPNPVDRDAYLALDLAEAGLASLTIYRTDGRLVYAQASWLDAGRQELMVPLSVWEGESGLFVYRVVAGGVSQEGRVVVPR